jgi:hypothetical protein
VIGAVTGAAVTVDPAALVVWEQGLQRRLDVLLSARAVAWGTNTWHSPSPLAQSQSATFAVMSAHWNEFPVRTVNVVVSMGRQPTHEVRHSASAVTA